MVANRDLERQKEFRKQQEIVAELKVLEYQRDKAARDAQYEAEQEKNVSTARKKLLVSVPNKKELVIFKLIKML